MVLCSANEREDKIPGIARQARKEEVEHVNKVEADQTPLRDSRGFWVRFRGLEVHGLLRSTTPWWDRIWPGYQTKLVAAFAW
ncbi:hypothetical protein SBV1_340018 [Verrucomicrobia bacterium]|nr:hypothetical protein SBV1_340018 [Verrucomicrobiota bacterium]